MRKRLATLALVVAVAPWTHPSPASDGHHLAFHGCEENEGECSNSPQVIICVQPGSCRFDGGKA